MKIISQFFFLFFLFFCKNEPRIFLQHSSSWPVLSLTYFSFFGCSPLPPHPQFTSPHWFKKHFEVHKSGVGLQNSTTRTTIIVYILYIQHFFIWPLLTHECLLLSFNNKNSERESFLTRLKNQKFSQGTVYKPRRQVRGRGGLLKYLLYFIRAIQ